MSHILGFDTDICDYNPALPQRPRWPGRSFLTDSCDAQALLGILNGQEVVYLLAQHRRELGYRVVKRITVFFTSCEYWEKPNLCFEIAEGK
jgi:hypothetical protein